MARSSGPFFVLLTVIIAVTAGEGLGDDEETVPMPPPPQPIATVNSAALAPRAHLFMPGHCNLGHSANCRGR
ncbi:MAG: hypothetical protein JO356_04980 [Acidobacteria bacterium]|nr:hypothetical protein [Acidobacteriota bacterium]